MTEEPHTVHVAARPSWDCRVCGTAWPCATAKQDLLAQYDRFHSGLPIYLAACLYEAVEDLAAGGSPVPPDLFGRFVGWSRRHDPRSNRGHYR